MRKIVFKFIITTLIVVIAIPSAFARFIDVVPQSAYYDAVEYFIYAKPILATDREEFKPLHDVTKAEFYKLVFASAGYEPSPGTYDVPYHDVNGDEWFAPYVKKALDFNIVSFSEDDPNFYAGSKVTRLDGIDRIFKVYNIKGSIPGNVSPSYNDVSKDDWFAPLSETTYNMELLSDYKTKYFNIDKILTRAETVHILYQIHEHGIPLPDLGELPEIPTDYDFGDISSQESFGIFLDVWEKIVNEYLDKEFVNKDILIYGAISGMVNKLNDPYSIFLEPLDSSGFFDSLDGEFEGIGIYLEQKDNEFIIVTPIKGSPAEEAGLKPNDIIIEIDDFPTTNLTLEEVILMLRGPIGSTVSLKVQRDDRAETFTVKREKIEISFVESEIQDGIAIIHYYQFTSISYTQFLEEIEKLKLNNPKAFILDLRNNPGGYLSSSQQILSNFIERGEKIVTLKFADGTVKEEISLGPSGLVDYPLAVIINGGSASASEIVALALQEVRNIPIVGTNSFGKGTIQEIISYKDGSSLKLSIARWTSPNGTFINEIGITPDYFIELTDQDIENNRDTQLEKALDLLK